MTKLHIFSDFDGTITETDTLVFLASTLGGGPQMVDAIGRLIREGKLSLREGIAAEMRSIRRPFGEAAELLRAQVRLDAGFAPLARWCEGRNIPLTVLSAGFHQFIDLFLSRDEFPRVEILANNIYTSGPNEQTGWRCGFRDETEWGHDKAGSLKAARSRGEHVIFIGDGLSDQGAAEVADEVFAKHSLAEYCRAREIDCHEFRTFEEILKQLQTRFE
jgi:2,3-diketo-5-methylthio-1-phosphopentane phosphatase